MNIYENWMKSTVYKMSMIFHGQLTVSYTWDISYKNWFCACKHYWATNDTTVSKVMAF